MNTPKRIAEKEAQKAAAAKKTAESIKIIKRIMDAKNIKPLNPS